MRVFKEWFRKLSRVQAVIFYLSLVLFVVLTVMHDPFNGYQLKYKVVPCNSIDEAPIEYRNSVYVTGHSFDSLPYYAYNIFSPAFDPRSYLSVGAMKKQGIRDIKDRTWRNWTATGTGDDHDLLTSLSGYLMLCGMLALFASGTIWLVGIRERPA